MEEPRIMEELEIPEISKEDMDKVYGMKELEETIEKKGLSKFKARLGDYIDKMAVFNLQFADSGPAVISHSWPPYLKLDHGGRGKDGCATRKWIIIPLDQDGMHIILDFTSGDPVNNYLWQAPRTALFSQWSQWSEVFIGKSKDQRYYNIYNVFRLLNFPETDCRLSVYEALKTTKGAGLTFNPNQKINGVRWPSVQDIKINEIEHIKAPSADPIEAKADIDFPEEVMLKSLNGVPPRESRKRLVGETIVPFIFIKDEMASIPAQQLHEHLNSPFYKICRYQYWDRDNYGKVTGLIGKEETYSFERTVGISKEDSSSMKMTTSITVTKEASLSVSGYGASASATYNRQLSEGLDVETSHSQTSMEQWTEKVETRVVMPDKECAVADWTLCEEYRIYRMKPDSLEWQEKPMEKVWKVRRPDTTWQDSFPHAESTMVKSRIS